MPHSRSFSESLYLPNQSSKNLCKILRPPTPPGHYACIHRLWLCWIIRKNQETLLETTLQRYGKSLKRFGVMIEILEQKNVVFFEKISADDLMLISAKICRKNFPPIEWNFSLLELSGKPKRSYWRKSGNFWKEIWGNDSNIMSNNIFKKNSMQFWWKSTQKHL